MVMSRLLFLLGSGISVDARMPDVAQISAQVRSGEGVFFGSDLCFHLDPENPSFDRLRPPVEPTIRFVRDLDRLAHDFYAALDPERSVDYEELAFLAGQIERAVNLSQENPALLPLIQSMAASSAGGDLRRVGTLAEQARNYISDVTEALLRRPPTRTDHLACVLDACREIKDVDLFTLNHDVVLEVALKRATPEIPLSDGFGREHGVLRIWNDEFTPGTVRLFKLHGSISWWTYRIAGGEHVTARVTNGDPLHARGPKGERIEIPLNDMRPLFLTGTFDKIFGYENWIFPDQHYRFHEALRTLPTGLLLLVTASATKPSTAG